MSRRWLATLRELFTQEQRDADLARELRAHLDAESDERVADGTPPDEARSAARRTLGNPTVIRERTREAWTWRRVAGAWRQAGLGTRQDVRYALRSVRKQPSFTLAAVLALALGIGATTTIFSVIQGVLLDPYPMYRNVDRLIQISIHDQANARPGGRGYLRLDEFLEYQRQATLLDEVIAGSGEDVLWTTSQGTEQLNGGLTTANTFTFLGVGALVGRTLTPDDGEPGASPVFVMSYKLWASRFGLDPSIVGRTFTFNDVPMTLVGVMPERVSKLAADVWMPLRLDPADRRLRDRYFRFQARLKPGVTLEQASAQLDAIGHRFAPTRPRDYPERFVVSAESFIDSIVGPFRRTLYTMAAAVALLLLIACTNVANMLLSRAAGREQEMGVRAALGASRTRLVRQLLIESLLLALAGAVIGCLFSRLGIAAIVALIPEGLIPREARIQLNMPVLLFSLGVAATTTLIFGLVPALQTARRQLTPALRDGGKGTGGGFRRARLSSGLVVAQIALALVLLNSAGLLMRSFIKMQGTSLGLDPERVLFVRVPNGTTLETGDAQQQFLAQALTRIRALPGVEAAASTTGFPPFGGYPADFDVVGAAPGQQRRAMVEQISEGYFTTLAMRLRGGRDLTADDVAGRRRVAIVNERLVDRYMKGGRSPIGERLSLALPGPEGRQPPEAFEIVGVVADVKNQGIREPVEPEVFVPASMVASRNSQVLLVKTAGAPVAMVRSVKGAIWEANRGVAVSDTESLATLVRRFQFAEPQLGLFVFGSFASIGLLLTILGVSSLIAYTVARQTREIGIRLAIGASRADVFRLTFGLGLRWLALGVAIGLAGSVAATRVLTQQLWDVSPTDPLTMALVVSLLAITGLAASYLPARRATRVDPLVVLRAE
jgi:putative ABC transport system permease protein